MSSANGGTFTEATGTSGDVSLGEAAVEAVYLKPDPTRRKWHEPDNVITIGSSAVGGFGEHDLRYSF